MYSILLYNIEKGTVRIYKIRRYVTMGLPQRKSDFHTIDDIYSLPDGTRAELIDGQIYYMSPPTRKHQRIVGELFRKISNYIEKRNGACEVDIAPFAVFLNQDNKNYVEPDISVICDKNKLTDKGCNGSPDCIIEVVSPSSKRMDYLIKLLKYQTAGVREYWIVDPDKNRIIVYNFETENINEYSFNDIVKTGIYDDLEIDFNSLNIG